MKLTATIREYLSALDIAIIGLHHLAAGWTERNPIIAHHLRKLADELGERAKATRYAIDRVAEDHHSPPDDTPTVVMRRPGFVKPPVPLGSDEDDERTPVRHVRVIDPAEPFPVGDFPTEAFDVSQIDAEIRKRVAAPGVAKSAEEREAEAKLPPVPDSTLPDRVPLRGDELPSWAEDDDEN